MRVIVSGATGFLGGHLCRHLKRIGEDVVGLGRNRDKGAALEAEGIGFVAADLSDTPLDNLMRCIGRADAFVHAAALSSAWGPAAAFKRANVDGTRHALVLAERAGAQRFVFVSSPSVCFRFADQVAQREDEPYPEPVNAYAASKQQAERVVLDWPGLSTVVLRPRAIYGRGDVALLPRLLRAARRGPLPLMRGGRALTNLTHVDDAVAAIAAALSAPPSSAGKTYNIAGGEELLVRDIIERAASRENVAVRWRAVPWPVARAVVRLTETVALLRPGRPEPAVTAFGLGILAFTQTLDTTAARRDLGFAPTVGLDEGLARTYDAAAGR